MVVPGKHSLPGLQMAIFLQCLHMANIENKLFSGSSNKDTNPIIKAHPNV